MAALIRDLDGGGQCVVISSRSNFMQWVSRMIVMMIIYVGIMQLTTGFKYLTIDRGWTESNEWKEIDKLDLIRLTLICDVVQGLCEF